MQELTAFQRGRWRRKISSIQKLVYVKYKKKPLDFRAAHFKQIQNTT